MPVSAIKVVPPAPPSGRRGPKSSNVGNSLCNSQLAGDTFEKSKTNLKK